MRKTKEDTEASRQSIINAAKRIFCEKGYSATKLEDIGKAVGMTRGVIYWHFKNKSELFQYLVEDAVGSAENMIDEVLAEDLPIMEKLRRLFLRSQENPGVALLKSIGPEEKVTKQFRKYIDDKGKKIIGKTAKAFDEAKDRGELRADTDMQSILGLLTIFMTGLASSTRIGMSIHPDITDVEGMTNIIFNGILSYQRR